MLLLEESKFLAFDCPFSDLLISYLISYNVSFSYSLLTFSSLIKTFLGCASTSFIPFLLSVLKLFNQVQFDFSHHHS